MKKIHVNSLEPSQQQLNGLLEHYQAGRYVDAEKLSLSITQEFPKHQFAWKVLAIVLKQNGRINESLIVSQKSVELGPLDAEAHYNLGVLLEEQGKLKEAEVSFRQTIELKPDLAEAHYNLGITLQKLGRLDEAETSYRKAIALKPNLAIAHSNLGITLQKLGRLDEAETSYRKLIELKPDLAEAHYNLGITLQELGRFEESEGCYRKAIVLKPNYAEAHRNLGTTLQELGRLEEAMNSYTKAIELNPHSPWLLQDLTGLFTSYTPDEGFLHPVAKVNKEIKKNYLKDKTIGIISDDKIIKLFNQSTSIIKKYNLKTETQSRQIFRKNSINLNCERHMKIFNKFNVIPKFCFGCYKVQVEPRNILDLIKLLIVFDQIKLIENNIRKCMIEMRSEISGFYKGLIYCSNLEEAYQIANYIEILVKENIGSKMHIIVRRGCSEYPIAFPDYKEINKSGSQLMKYNENWKSIEEEDDLLNCLKSNRIITPTLTGLNLQDILIIRNWIDYAKGIGDSSVHLLKQNKIFSQTIYNKAKKRSGKYKDN
jgi:tetratricopeptide (TPR) repeat protein